MFTCSKVYGYGDNITFIVFNILSENWQNLKQIPSILILKLTCCWSYHCNNYHAIDQFISMHVRENRRSNEEWTIQRYWQLWTKRFFFNGVFSFSVSSLSIIWIILDLNILPISRPPITSSLENFYLVPKSWAFR